MFKIIIIIAVLNWFVTWWSFGKCWFREGWGSIF